MNDFSDISLGVCAFKNETVRAIIVRICEKSLETGFVFPDEVSLEGIDIKDRACVGIAYRTMCSKYCRILIRSEVHRKSRAQHANGRIIFGFNLVNAGLAKTFIRKFSPAQPSLQLEMAV